MFCDNTAALACCEHTWISLRAQRDMFRRKNVAFSRRERKKTCSCNNAAAFARCEHTWISLGAQRDMCRRKDCCVLTPRAHVDLAQETCSIEKTAAFSRREHSWISLRAQARRHVHATDCCVRTPQAHLDLSPTCSVKTTAAFSRREHTWISLRAQGDMSHRKDCCDLALPPKIDEFYLRTPDPVSTVARTRPLRYREPVTGNPSQRAFNFALQIVEPITVYAVGDCIHIYTFISLFVRTHIYIYTCFSCVY